ncbi:MAG: low molecular weight phosphotyrosine protein phosphatase, partial [Betaproteobacteria bacterium]
MGTGERAPVVVLFVCTGNIFRSLTAEYALRRELGAQSAVAVASAGIHDYPHV